ncbi:MAG: phosphoenolpyruvate carboxykinase (GTP) [candidate division WOR-3 bacterium]
MLQKFEKKFKKDHWDKLLKIKNNDLFSFLSFYLELLNPKEIYLVTEESDFDYIKKRALETGEEILTATPGHTIHFDNYYDQARDKKNTKILLREEEKLGEEILIALQKEGLDEIHKLLKDIMRDRELYIIFYLLGPKNSPYAIPAVQLTDSSYVCHCENLLYRLGYETFLKLKDNRFFKFIHSQGELDERKTCKNLDKRRIYIDRDNLVCYSVNTQYGGNSIGLKKLAMRLAIYLGYNEGWLCEHMLIMGINGPNGRVTYFTGAFPSYCGKTSTAMMEGERLVGDDIAYLFIKNGELRAINVEKGMFGILEGINEEDDPMLYKALTTPREVIFANALLTKEGFIFWNGKTKEIPKEGYNFSGEWYLGKKDEKGKEIPASHNNSRFTIELKHFENLDLEALENPEGVLISGIVYGGRDTDTSLPVEEAFDWAHGVITKGAALESETTPATLGETGIKKINPMSNLDFLSISLSKYLKIYLEFGKKLKREVKIFGVNYFLKDKNGNFLNEKTDKKVWYKWMEKRVHNEVKAIKTPTGYIPYYEDLKILFREVLNKDYSLEDYHKQFSLRVNENLSKIERIIKFYEKENAPEEVFQILKEQKERLLKAQNRFGDYIIPEKFITL